MKRRASFRTIIGCMAATVAGRCVAFGEVAKFYWPGRWSQEKLIAHMVADPKHPFSRERLEALTFQELIDLHDWHHCEIGHRARTPYPNGRQLPDTDEGRGETTVPNDQRDWQAWADAEQS